MPQTLRQCVSVIPQWIATKFVLRVGVVSKLKTYFRKFFSPTSKKIWPGKTCKLSRTVVNQKHVTLKWLNISINEFQTFHLR